MSDAAEVPVGIDPRRLASALAAHIAPLLGEIFVICEDDGDVMLRTAEPGHGYERACLRAIVEQDGAPGPGGTVADVETAVWQALVALEEYVVEVSSGPWPTVDGDEIVSVEVHSTKTGIDVGWRSASGSLRLSLAEIPWIEVGRPVDLAP